MNARETLVRAALSAKTSRAGSVVNVQGALAAIRTDRVARKRFRSAAPLPNRAQLANNAFRTILTKTTCASAYKDTCETGKAANVATSTSVTN